MSASTRFGKERLWNSEKKKTDIMNQKKQNKNTLVTNYDVSLVGRE
jgi:hypothetical protein